MQDRSVHETLLRIDAIRVWATQAVEGATTPALALTAISQLTIAAEGFLYLDEAA
jgi:hypothetical protein